MVFGVDGALFADARDETKSIVRIAGIDDVETIAEDLSGNAILGDAHIAVAPDGAFYVYDEDSRGLYALGFDGDSREIANLQYLGGIPESVMTAAPWGEIYLVPHHRFMLFRMDANGDTKEWVQDVKGDPSGMVVSADGNVLCVSLELHRHDSDWFGIGPRNDMQSRARRSESKRRRPRLPLGPPGPR